MSFRNRCALAISITGLTVGALASTTSTPWTPVQNVPTGLTAYEGLLLTDGSVIIQAYDTKNWYRLAPDANGNYATGTWSKIATLQPGYVPVYYSSAVLADGRVLLQGGEFNLGGQSWTTQGAIYDPVANTWTSHPGPTGWIYVGDAQNVVFPDGTMMIASISNTKSAMLNPATLAWTEIAGTGKDDRGDEEGYTLLPDGSVLTIDCIAAPKAQRFIRSTQTWISASSTPKSLVDPNSQEIGPMVLRPNGTVFAVGATGHSAVYTPPTSLFGTGSWAAGPDLPLDPNRAQLLCADAPACLLPNGNVLFAASPGVYAKNAHFFEFDGANLNEVQATPNAVNDSCYNVDMLMLPNGQVLVTDGSSDIELYTPAGSADPSWAPTITSCPSTISRSGDYTISGTQFNGLSQCTGYGDDFSNATNYPIVRVINNATGHMFYCRTHDHSTMGVATGSTIVSTHFTAPANLETGDSTVQVVANGIASSPFPITVTAPTLGLTLADAAVTGGATSHGTFTLSNPATTGQYYVVSSTDPSAGVPSGSTPLNTGDTSGTFALNTLPVDVATTPTITVTAAGATNSATITINPAVLVQLNLASATVAGSGSVTASVSLNGAAGPSGTLLTLQSDNAAAVVPASVRVPSGASSVSFTITTISVDSDQTANISATAGGVSVTSFITIKHAAPSSLSVAPAAVLGGTGANATLTLSGKAGPSGATFTVSSDDPMATPPTTITVAAGTTSKTFSIATQTSASTHVANITVSDGTTPTQAPLTITPPTIMKFSSAYPVLTGGQSASVVLQISTKAPATGFPVSIASDNAAAKPPSTVTIPAGSNYVSFTIPTASVATQQTPTITATYGQTSSQMRLTLNPPIPTILSISPTSLSGGQISKGRVSVSGKAATGGMTLNLTSDNPAVATVPATTFVPAGVNYSSPQFNITTFPVTTSTIVHITVDDGNGHSVQTAITVNP